MKRAMPVILALLVICLMSTAVVHAQKKVDLNGIWSGSTFVNGADIDLILTLDLKEKDGKITGKLSDDMGYIASDISDVTFEDAVLKFSAAAVAPEGEIPMVFEMTVVADTLKGEWTADYYNGKWKAVKKKKDK